MSVCPNFFFDFSFEISDGLVRQLFKIERARALWYIQAGWNIFMVTEKTDGHKSTISKLANKLTDWEKKEGLVVMASLFDIKKIIRLHHERKDVRGHSGGSSY